MCRRRRIKDKRSRLGNVCLAYCIWVVAMKRNISVNLGKRKLLCASAERSHLEIWSRELQRVVLEAQAQQIITDFLSETLNLFWGREG